MKGFLKKLSLVMFVLSWVLVGKIAKAEATHGSGSQVRVKTLELFDEVRKRPMKLTVWYLPHPNCEAARMCLAEKVQLQQAALISHGTMGSAQDYNWIGYALASQGIVVVGINHYGESYLYGQEHIDHQAALRFWERPADVSFTLDVLEQNKIESSSIFNKKIDWQNVTGIGHSSGGATMIASIGGELNLAQASRYCGSDIAKQDKSCGYLRYLPKTFSLPQEATKSFKDNRIRRVIALDPALGHVMTRESLNNIAAPVMIIGSKLNDFLVFETHSGFYANNIPTAQLITLDKGEGHFIYLDTCHHEHKAMGISLCNDRQGINRELVHQQAYPALFSFIFSQ